MGDCDAGWFATPFAKALHYVAAGATRSLCGGWDVSRHVWRFPTPDGDSRPACVKCRKKLAKESK